MDELTSLGNRSFFHRAAKRRMELYERNALPLACAILDVDDFKFYNDNHGHEGEDARIVGYYAPDQRVKPSEGLGHQGGVLRGFYQDPACELPRIPLPRTRVNKDKKEGRVLRKGTRPLHRVD
jgi:hypothetical protein